jgi:hypothetical protein
VLFGKKHLEKHLGVFLGAFLGAFSPENAPRTALGAFPGAFWNKASISCSQLPKLNQVTPASLFPYAHSRPMIAEFFPLSLIPMHVPFRVSAEYGGRSSHASNRLAQQA